jgi:hypothetical protein
MSLAAVKTFVPGEVLLAADLNAMNTNILNNAASLISPATAALDMNSFNLINVGAAHFIDSAADPSVNGYLQRNGVALKYYNGNDVGVTNHTLTSSFTFAGNTTGGEDELRSYTFPAGFFSTAFRCVEFLAQGFFAANANTKTLKLHIGSDSVVLNGVTTAPNNRNWTLRFLLYREGSNAQAARGCFTIDPINVDNALNFTSTQTEAGTIKVMITGESAAAASNDILLYFLVPRLIY